MASTDIKQPNIEFERSIIFAMPRIHMTTGGFQMTAADLGVPAKDLPPSSLASLGRMYTISPEIISEGNRIKKQYYSILAKYGYGTTGGFVLLDEELDKATPELDAKEAEFDEWRDRFIDNYKSNVETWIKDHPEYEKSIRARVKSLEYINAHVSFDCDFFPFQATDASNAKVAKSTKKRKNSLPQAAYREAQKAFSDIYDSSSERREVKAVTLNRIKTKILPKLSTYQFISKKVSALHDYLQTLAIEADKIVNSGSLTSLSDKDYDWFADSIKPIATNECLDTALVEMATKKLHQNKRPALF